MNSSIHVKLEYPESVEYKKEMLLSEKNVLGIMKHIQAYNQLRKIENALKTKIKQNLTELQKLIEEIDSKLPKEVAIPKISREEQKHRLLAKKEAKSDIEMQLEEIQAKLARLQ